MHPKNLNLNIDQTKLLHILFNKYSDIRDQFWYLFSISSSNFFYIKNLSFNGGYDLNEVISKEQSHKESLKYLSNLLKPPKQPMCIKSITKQVNSELNSNFMRCILWY